jgi:hypothetical protein
MVPDARDPKNRIPGWQGGPVNVRESISPEESLPDSKVGEKKGEVPIKPLGMWTCVRRAVCERFTCKGVVRGSHSWDTSDEDRSRSIRPIKARGNRNGQHYAVRSMVLSPYFFIEMSTTFVG